MCDRRLKGCQPFVLGDEGSGSNAEVRETGGKTVDILQGRGSGSAWRGDVQQKEEKETTCHRFHVLMSKAVCSGRST